MSRLFYHVMQDNAGNLLFDVSGTMRIAGSGTLATIYGDEALTVILPNPMTNHPSFGSFKCFLGAGDYDFYMAKAGYSFETLTGVQGHGTLAQQDANNVAITGGTAVVSTLNVNMTSTRGSLTAQGGIFVPNYTPSGNDPYALFGDISAGANRFNMFLQGTASNFLNGSLLLKRASEVAGVPASLLVSHNKSTTHGIVVIPNDTDTGGGMALQFVNLAGGTVGTIATTATTTAYNTSSDVRLKRNVTTLVGELAVIRALRPVRFRWLSNDAPGYGFLASEVQEVLPDAGIITGEANDVEEDGRIRPQMIDYSKLVPWLVGAVQTLAGQVETLSERVTELEAGA